MKKINIVLFGVGNIGSALINQILAARERFKESGDLEVNIPIVVNSTTAFFDKTCVAPSWETDGRISIKKATYIVGCTAQIRAEFYLHQTI